MSEELCQGECNSPNCQQELLLSRMAENKCRLGYHVIVVFSFLALGVFTLGAVGASSGFMKVVIIGVFCLQIAVGALNIVACPSVLIERGRIKAQLEHLEWARAAMPTT